MRRRDGLQQHGRVFKRPVRVRSPQMSKYNLHSRIATTFHGATSKKVWKTLRYREISQSPATQSKRQPPSVVCALVSSPKPLPDFAQCRAFLRIGPLYADIKWTIKAHTSPRPCPR
ncbi:uncharacterized protein LACBIDRAFT_318134 [Laccaria bicolor S238N-H82]|uniref:Predicted protein n=1 Tax=Laccaria bicolor (strain S238N-H82 / ATCC MYA-4686) TaxID=486041 RepID=B0D628_LACBS|nr:uncharacterized protein LACBIDRAFT_318134 [Laccaria bicolor S238N-H82]EDR10128.1 predicted protein [Laccaria bicolor S238N-H82]|eukprot:XP_001879513.1 predicted protein [Laccaria bicolor S238N-H82]